jgi:uncharacterized repeat protein (TIGR01451 family)
MNNFFSYIFIVICSLPEVVAQQTYYVAANGNDLNNGTSVSTPFQTITKVNTLSLQAGSRILFRRGDTFRGMIMINYSGTAANPIVIDAYGTGRKPIVSGASVVSGWTYTTDGKWQATCSSCGSTVTGLYDNGVSQPLGRYPNPDEPNRGYLTVQSHTTNTRVVSREAVPYNFVGGEIAIRSNYFVIDRAVVTQQNSNTLTVTNGSYYEFTDNFGYFFQNHPNTIDRKGEWYYNPANKQITLYDNLGNPNNRLITATTFSQGITARGRAGISINNVEITETLNIGLYIENSSDITVRNTDITDSGEIGAYFSGTGTNVLLENNTIIDGNTRGFQIDTYSNFTFRGNTIRRIGLEPGRGLSGDNQYNGFTADSRNNALIELNRIDSVGYCGLNFPSVNATVQRNVVSNWCLTKNDGGAYYLTNNQNVTTGNIVLANNIAYNGIGVPEGTPDGFLGANGIYIDNCVTGVTVRNNTVFRTSSIGIVVNNSTNVLSENNTCFDNEYAQFSIDEFSTCPSVNNTTRNNVFVSKKKNQFTGLYYTNKQNLNIANFGTFNNNLYARSVDDVQTLRLSYLPPNAQLYDSRSLFEWQTAYNRDLDSRTSPVTHRDYIFNSFTGPERVVGGDFTFNSGFGFGGPFVFSDAGNGQGTWDNNNRVGSGGSLNLSFTSVSGGPGASLYAAQVINAVSKDRDYIIRFNAVSTVPNRLVQVYIQYQNPPFLQLVETYPAVVVGTTPGAYEVLVRPLCDLDNALAVLRVFESNQPLFVDNFSFREADVTRISPDKLTTILYNPTAIDSTAEINGTYRTATNQQVQNQVTVPAFGSVILFREPSQTAGLADLTIRLESDRLVTSINQPVTFRIRVRNSGVSGALAGPISARWRIVLPPNLQVISSSGLQLQNRTLSGRAFNVPAGADTVFTFQARPTIAGAYSLYATIESSSFLDLDSTPGIIDNTGEDDEAQLIIRTRESSVALFGSPVLRPQGLRPVTPYSVPTDVTKADLSLFVATSRRVLRVNETVSVTVTVANSGGAYASSIQLQNVLPNGFQFVSGIGWTANGNTLTASLGRLAVGQQYTFVFTARATTAGRWVNSAQIIGSDKADTDSSPNNGFTRGEDDQAQVDIRVN